MTRRGRRHHRDEIAVRGAVAGVATAGGAIVAHSMGGGEVVPLAALAALVVAAPLSSRLMRPGRTDSGRLLAISLVVQAFWHGFLALTSAVAPQASTAHGSGAMHGMPEMQGMPATPAHHASADMLLLHLAAGLLAAGLAVGADRALVELARELVGRLLPTLPRLLHPPVAGPLLVLPLLRAPSGGCPRPITARGPPSYEAHSPLLA